MVGGLLIQQLWERWEIQILVLLSFILQVILLVFSEIRRRRVPTPLKVILWLSYQMADSTAIYALGHMSLSSRSHEHQLVAFWAPLLLLHLAGPDTITAYSAEDNRLWLRHLQTMVVQVLGAAYVLYLCIVVSSAGTLVPAAVLLFITGFLKYGERTWALRCANLESIGGSLDESDGAHPAAQPLRHGPKTTRTIPQGFDDEEVLLDAHYMLGVGKSQFVDALRMKNHEYEAIDRGIELKGDMYLYDVVEMELSLMYDMLYTKAGVIHTWYGCCIRVLSPLVTVSAFLLFQFHGKNAYSRVDIGITYALLAGALVLESTTACRALGSSWTCRWLRSRGWERLLGVVLCLRRLVKAAGNKKCLDSIGQYNMLDFCTRDTGELRGRIAKKVCLEDWWNKVHYSSTVPVEPWIKELVLEGMRKRGKEDATNARGKWSLSRRGLYEELGWSIDLEFHQSILVWHLATDFYLHRSKEEAVMDPQAHQQLPKDIKVLSNYMLYLLVAHPYLLPGVFRPRQFKENIRWLTTRWFLKKDSTMQYRNSSKELARLEVPDASIYRPDDRHDDDDDDNTGYRVDGRAHVDATKLASTLLRNRWNIPVADMLEMIAGVWVEMLCYAGHHCGAESHARKLSSGSEFVTVAWLLLGHASMYDSFKEQVSLPNIIPGPGFTVTLAEISEFPDFDPRGAMWEEVIEMPNQPSPTTLPTELRAEEP